ncbi:MAG: hypothetical protein AAF488_11665 [Planctomycetota bacterium]
MTSPDPGFSLEREAPELHALLQRAHRRRGVLRLLDGATWGLLCGVLAAIGVVLVDRLISPTWGTTPVPVFLSSVVAGSILLGALTAWLFRPRDPLRAALDIEGEVALKERLSSILFLQRESRPVDPEAVAALLHDGDDYARRVDLRRAIPRRRPRALLAALISAAVFGGALFLPHWDLLGKEEQRQQVAKEEERVEKARKRQQERIRELQDIAEKKKVDPRTQKLLAKMQKREEPKKSENRPKANGEAKRRELAKMDEMRREAKELRNRTEMKKLDNLLDQLQNAGQKMQSKEGKQLSKALQKGDLSQASEAMKQLADKMKELAKDPSKSDELNQMKKDLAKLANKMNKAGATPSSEALEKALSEMDKLSEKELGDMLSDVASDLGQLERLARERDVLDQALQDINLTEAELASLPAEYPEAQEPCEECKAGGT